MEPSSKAPEALNDEKIRALRKIVRINAPSRMLYKGLLEKFLLWRVQPEIGLDGQSILELPRRFFLDAAKRLKAAGLSTSVHGPFLDLSPGAKDPGVLAVSRERYHQALEIAALFEPEHIVFHPTYESQRFGFYRQEWLEVSVETWRPVVRRAVELGIRPVLENTHESFPEEMAPLLDALVADGARFCFDIGHATSFAKAGVMVWPKAFEKHVRALHLHDNNGVSDDHLAIGQGGIDFKTFFEWMGAHFESPPAVTLEPHREEQVAPTLTALAELWPWPLS